jgi:hypothetical protein
VIKCHNPSTPNHGWVERGWTKEEKTRRRKKWGLRKLNDDIRDRDDKCRRFGKVKNAHTISVGKRSSEKTTWEDVDIKLK